MTHISSSASTPQPSSIVSVSSPSVVVHDPTEKAIERMIEGTRKSLNPQYGNTTPEEEATAVIKINPATRKHFEMKIKTLQDAPRDPDKLRGIKSKTKRVRKSRG